MPNFVKLDKLNKEIKCASVALGKAGKELIRTTSYQVTDRTKDFYESDPDFAENVAKQRTAGGVYGARFAYRSTRSAINAPKKHKVKKLVLNNYVENEKQKFLNANPDVDEDTLKAKEAAFRKQGKKLVNKNKEKIYKKSGIKAGLKPMQSSKRMIANQSRKAINHLKEKDTGGKVIGSSAKALYYVARYHRAIFKTVGIVVKFVKNIFMFGFGMLTSGLGLLVTVLTSLPLLIVLMAVICLCNIISSSSYSGRLTEFVDNEVYLEYRYQANVAPDEILSITQVLGWSTEDKEDYESLFAIMLDGKDDDWNISYDKMLDNVFKKYNPAKYKWEDKKIKVQRENIFGIDKTEYLTYDDYLDLFPKYKNNKTKYGTDKAIADMKKQAYQFLDESGSKYASCFFDEEEAAFKHDPLSLKDINKNSATYKVGFRSFMNGAFHGGADIAAAEGTKAYAVTDGKVIATFNSATASGDICTDKDKRTIALCGLNHAGNQVVIQHEIIDKREGSKAYLYIAYFHLQKDSVKVNVGDHVKAGDVIGKTGNTGMSFGGHLHFQSWIDKQNRYQLPSTASGNAVIKANENTIDPTMLCSEKFRNHIYGR